MSMRPLLRIQFQQQRGVDLAVDGRLVDCNDKACTIEAEADLAVNMPVTIIGDLLGSGPAGANKVFRGRVEACEPSSDWTWRAQVVFAESLRAQAAPKQDPPYDNPAGSAKREQMPLENVEDYYELLQLSPNADGETIQRVYRILAARYHPDNLETGNADSFRHVREAYNTLSDADRRAAYDADYQTRRKLRWKIFDQPSAAQGKQAERAKRQGILSLLYTKRVATPEHPGMSIVELEDMLGVPREHLDFSLWFLKESGFVTRTDSGRLSITLKGVVEAEHEEVLRMAALREDRMLEAPTARPHAYA